MDDTKKQLRDAAVRPHKSRGQNFLQDSSFAEDVVDFASLPTGKVLEIGPGLGALTGVLLRRGYDLSVVEVEEGLARKLPSKFPQLTPERIFRSDVRELKLDELFQEKIAVVGNVPYSISTDLIFWVIENRRFITHACFLMQREFAERIGANLGERDGGIITAARMNYADATLGPVIAGDQFYPPAKVESRLVRLVLRENPRTEIPRFTEVVKAAFSHRRKTILNSLRDSGILQEGSECRAWLERAAISPERRAETLSFEEFVRLTETLTPVLKES